MIENDWDGEDGCHKPGFYSGSIFPVAHPGELRLLRHLIGWKGVHCAQAIIRRIRTS